MDQGAIMVEGVTEVAEVEVVEEAVAEGEDNDPKVNRCTAS